MDESLSLSRTFDVLASSHRRKALAVLGDTALPVSEQFLAGEIAARFASEQTETVSEDRTMEMYTTLRHVHLPKLASAGLVDRDLEDGQIVAVTPSIDGETVLSDVVDRGEELDSVTLDRLCDVLSNPRHRAILATLRDATEPLTVEELVRAMKARDVEMTSREDLRYLRTELHHTILPKLVDLELLEMVDVEDGTAYEYLGHSFLRPGWF